MSENFISGRAGGDERLNIIARFPGVKFEWIVADIAGLADSLRKK